MLSSCSMLKKHELVLGRKNNEQSFVLFYFVWRENRKKMEGGWSLERQTVWQQPPGEGNSEGKESKSKEGVPSVFLKGAPH